MAACVGCAGGAAAGAWGFLGPAGLTGQWKWGGLGFWQFRYFKLQTLGSTLHDGFVLCRQRGSWGLLREAELESYVLLLSFTPLLPRSQCGTKSLLQDNGHDHDVVLLSVWQVGEVESLRSFLQNHSPLRSSSCLYCVASSLRSWIWWSQLQQGMASRAVVRLHTSTMSESGRGEAGVLLLPPSQEAAEAVGCVARAGVVDMSSSYSFSDMRSSEAPSSSSRSSPVTGRLPPMWEPWLGRARSASWCWPPKSPPQRASCLRRLLSVNTAQYRHKAGTSIARLACSSSR